MQRLMSRQASREREDSVRVWFDVAVVGQALAIQAQRLMLRLELDDGEVDQPTGFLQRGVGFPEGVRYRLQNLPPLVRHCCHVPIFLSLLSISLSLSTLMWNAEECKAKK
jgi:hypothetical protein